MVYGFEKEEHAFKKFNRNLKEGSFPSNVVMYGEEDYLIDWAVNSLVNKYVDAHARDFDFVKIEFSDGTYSVSDIVEICDTFSMMSEKRLVWVKDFSPLKRSTVKGVNTEELNALMDYAANPNENTILVLSEDKIDSKLKFTLGILNNAAEYNFCKLDKPQLVGFIEKRFRNSGLEISRDVIAFLIEETGYLHKETDYRIYNLENDIKKIIALCSGSKVTQDDISATIYGDMDTFVFSFTDAVSSNRKSQAFELLENILSDGAEVYSILGLLVTNFEMMLMVKEFENEGFNRRQISEQLKTGEFRIKKAAAFAERFTADRLKDILRMLYETDRKIKTGALEQKLALELLMGQI